MNFLAARKAHGDAAGTRSLVEVLLLHRHLDRADVIAGITAALVDPTDSAAVIPAITSARSR
ncbi:hypothetical protein MAHJHV55_54370 [Mycobacterium avium subsp. hominissuis]